jgi:hypothetical protein
MLAGNSRVLYKTWAQWSTYRIDVLLSARSTTEWPLTAYNYGGEVSSVLARLVVIHCTVRADGKRVT